MGLTQEDLADSLVCSYFDNVLKLESPIKPKIKIPAKNLPKFNDAREFFFYVSDILKKAL